MTKAKIKEIFTSIQGEGLYIGCKQMFIRFAGCNLSCAYCDTDFDAAGAKEYDVDRLAALVNKEKNIHSVSLTGGEPLLQAEFLEKFLPLVEHKIYLETNATMPEALLKTARYVDIIAMDIKLDSSSCQGDLFERHRRFIEIAKNERIETFLKVIFCGFITDSEIKNVLKLAMDNDLELILQPQMLSQQCLTNPKEILKIYDKFNYKYNKVRLIPQMHKFLGIE